MTDVNTKSSVTTYTALGATIDGDGVHFATWAPNAEAVTLTLQEEPGARDIPMAAQGDGSHAVHVPGIAAGARYAFRFNGGEYPDPYSRFQPEGVHGPSEVIDPTAFAWSDAAWSGLTAEGLVIYELHVGTFTPEGTFRALIDELDELKLLGVTAIELMPVAQCPGSRNWGYDGVDLFAPHNAYGTPDDLRALVDAAHATGIGVILDVVYNHFGPEGAYQAVFADQYFSDRHHTPWGAGLNWDGPGSEWVRRYAIDNACQWITEYHIDGLRLDATHAIIDDSSVHLVQELTARAREAAAPRPVVVFAEDGRHEISRARPADRGGEGTDGVWADDFHHEVRVMLTNAHENYYAAYNGSAVSIARTIEQGFSPVTELKGVTPVDPADPASAFVFCIQNHDQVGNRPFGDRLHHEINADRYAVVSALLLYAPETPLLFMGQEFAASTPFLFFTDHPEPLGHLVTQGRRGEFAGFGAFHDPDLRETIPDPQADATFQASKLRLAERQAHAGIYRLYQDLLALRRHDPVLSVNDRGATRATALTSQLIAVHRWQSGEHRLLLANVGNETTVDLAAIPDLPETEWSLLLHTGAARYGDNDLQSTLANGRVTLPARTASIWRLDRS